MKMARRTHQSPVLWCLCWSLLTITLTSAHPFLYLRGYGRNIRPLQCVSKGGGTGVCMFAWDCMKANGTHLGTCIDRFYFGSCCKMNYGEPEITNEIPSTITEIPPRPASFDEESEEDKTDDEHMISTDDHSSIGQTSPDGVSQIYEDESSSESLSTNEVSVGGSSSAVDGQTSGQGQTGTGEQGSTGTQTSSVGQGSTSNTVSTDGYSSTSGPTQSNEMTTIDTLSSSDETSSINEQTGSVVGTGVTGSGTGIGTAMTGSGTEIGSDGSSSSEAGIDITGSGTEVGSDASSGTELGTGVTGSGSDLGSDSIPGQEAGTGVTGSGIEVEGDAISGTDVGSEGSSGTEEGTGVTGSGTEEGTGVTGSGTEEGTGVTGSGTGIGSGTSSLKPSESIGDEVGITLIPPMEDSDSLSSTTEVNMAVDPKPMQPEITSPGVIGESSSTSVGAESSTEFPGNDFASTIMDGSSEDSSENEENQPSTHGMASVTPVNAPSTEFPNIVDFGETQTEKFPGSGATITIEETKPTPSTEIPEIVSIAIDTTSSGPDDSGISKTTVDPSVDMETATTLPQEVFIEDSTQPFKPSELFPPVIAPIIPGSIVPASITQEPFVTTLTPLSSTEGPSVATNFPILFPEGPSVSVSTIQPIINVVTDKPESTSTERPEESEVTDGPEDAIDSEEDEDKPTITEVPEATGDSDSSESDTTDITTITPVNTESPEQELLNRLNTSSYKDICGSPVYPTKRIVGGSEATFGEWPWQVSLRQWRQVTFLHKCGAALLNENWAITAAHCVENVQPDDLLLRLGEFDLETSDEPYPFTERKVQIVATHPQFDPRTFEYDLALLRFHEPVNFLPNIIPICVPQDDYTFINDTGYVTGWGRLYEEGPLPSVLQKVPVPVITNEECEGMYRVAGYVEHIPNIFICAGYEKGSRDSCEGDSGGPLVIQRKDGRWYLAGVISWGIGCALPNQPGVYTRISEFREWIEKIIVF